MDKETIVAIVRIILPCIISVCGVLGITTVCGVSVDEFNTEQVITVLTVLLGGVLSIWTGWKNNNVTKNAKHAQRYLDELNKAESENDSKNDIEIES